MRGEAGRALRGQCAGELFPVLIAQLPRVLQEKGEQVVRPRVLSSTATCIAENFQLRAQVGRFVAGSIGECQIRTSESFKAAAVGPLRSTVWRPPTPREAELTAVSPGVELEQCPRDGLDPVRVLRDVGAQAVKELDARGRAERAPVTIPKVAWVLGSMVISSTASPSAQAGLEMAAMVTTTAAQTLGPWPSSGEWWHAENPKAVDGSRKKSREAA